MFGLVMLGVGLAWAAWGMFRVASGGTPAPASDAPLPPATPSERAAISDRARMCGVRPYDFAYTERWTQQRFGVDRSLDERLAALRRSNLPMRQWPDYVRRVDCVMNPQNGAAIIVPRYRPRLPLPGA